MKKMIFVSMFALAAIFTILPGCGDWERFECNVDSDCADDLVCGVDHDGNGNRCIDINVRCNNGLLDGGESSIDCGFACRESEPPNLCPEGMACVNNADCDGTKNLTCVNGFCRVSAPVCTSNNDCSGGTKVCFSTGCGDCVNDAQCGSGKECKNGSCQTKSNSCGSGCSTGYVCVDNACIPGSAQNFLCATPQVAISMTCWNQFTGGAIDATYPVAVAQRVCCPTSSGSFTTDPFTTNGSYTGYQGTDVVRSFQTWTNNLGQSISGGFK